MTNENDGRSEALTDEDLDLESKEITIAHGWTDVALKQIVGIVALVLMVGQIIAADTVFIVYAVNNGWDVPTAAITAWLGATVVEVVGVVLVVTKGVFSQE